MKGSHPNEKTRHHVADFIFWNQNQPLPATWLICSNLIFSSHFEGCHYKECLVTKGFDCIKQPLNQCRLQMWCSFNVKYLKCCIHRLKVCILFLWSEILSGWELSPRFYAWGSVQSGWNVLGAESFCSACHTRRTAHRCVRLGWHMLHYSTWAPVWSDARSARSCFATLQYTGAGDLAGVFWLSSKLNVRFIMTAATT